MRMQYTEKLMSTVFLHIGQCGNQLGHTFWEEVSGSKWSSDKNSTSNSKAFPKGKAPTITTAPISSNKCPTTTRKPPITKNVPYSLIDDTIPCILVDAEPKVIRQCLNTKTRSNLLAHQVPTECFISDKMGCGNNWACGYNGRGRGSGCGLLNRVEEAVRKVVERCDRFSGFIMFHSIAGGTGSGLGSVLLENLRTNYALSYIISVAVAPFSHGETPLQHYNSLLCLSWLQAYSDAVLLFGNDSVLEQAQKYMTRSEGSSGERGVAGRRIERERDMVSMQDMNGHISSILCNALMPIWQPNQKLPKLAFQEPWELIRSLCPDPRLKFITSNHVHLSRSSSTWSQATSCILQHSTNTLWRKAADSKAQTSSLVVITRGSPSNMELFLQGITPLETKLKKVYNCVKWNPFPVDHWMSHEPALGQTKLVSVLANSSVILDYVGTVHEKASVMFKKKAYLHWYERYGCEKRIFEHAFDSVQGIIDNYNNM